MAILSGMLGLMVLGLAATPAAAHDWGYGRGYYGYGYDGWREQAWREHHHFWRPWFHHGYYAPAFGYFYR